MKKSLFIFVAIGSLFISLGVNAKDVVLECETDLLLLQPEKKVMSIGDLKFDRWRNEKRYLEAVPYMQSTFTPSEIDQFDLTEDENYFYSWISKDTLMAIDRRTLTYISKQLVEIQCTIESEERWMKFFQDLKASAKEYKAFLESINPILEPKI